MSVIQEILNYCMPVITLVILHNSFQLSIYLCSLYPNPRILFVVLHSVPLGASSVTTSTRLLRADFISIKIIECDLKKVSCNEHPVITRFFCIILFVVVGPSVCDQLCVIWCLIYKLNLSWILYASVLDRVSWSSSSFGPMPVSKSTLVMCRPVSIYLQALAWVSLQKFA